VRSDPGAVRERPHRGRIRRDPSGRELTGHELTGHELTGHELTDIACALLGWTRAVPIELEVLGVRLVVAARPQPDEIAVRLAAGPAPAADPWQLRLLLDDDPGFLTRPAPVRLAGAIAVRHAWRPARTAAGVFTAFGPRAVLLPERRCTPRVLLEADLAGIGVLAARPGCRTERLVAAAPAPEVPRSHVHRLVEECVFHALLGLPGAGPVGAERLRSEPLPEGQVTGHLRAGPGEGERLVTEHRRGALGFPGLPARSARGQ
jgi:hypothetical protein